MAWQSTILYDNHIGVAACISPWNLPLYLLTWKIAPALAAGNTVVAKPSEVTPMTAYLFSKICIEAGLPKGVLNIVHGLGSKTGDPLTTHPDMYLLFLLLEVLLLENISQLLQLQCSKNFHWKWGEKIQILFLQMLTLIKR